MIETGPNTTKATTDKGRRNFLRILSGAAGAAAALSALDKLEAAPEMVAALLSEKTANIPQSVIDASPTADVLIRMQADLARALKKQPSERRWVQQFSI